MHNVATCVTVAYLVNVILYNFELIREIFKFLFNFCLYPNEPLETSNCITLHAFQYAFEDKYDWHLFSHFLRATSFSLFEQLHNNLT